MANTCPQCGSADVQAGFDDFKCLSCTAKFDYDDNLKDQKAPVLVGNLADLQRMGTRVLADEPVAPAFLAPANVDEDEAQEAAKDTVDEQLVDGFINTPTDEDALAEKEEAEAEAAKPKRKSRRKIRNEGE